MSRLCASDALLRRGHHHTLHLVLPRAQWACSGGSARHAETVKFARMGGGGANKAFTSLHPWAGYFFD